MKFSFPASSALAATSVTENGVSKVGAIRFTCVDLDTSGNLIVAPGGTATTCIGVAQQDQPVAGQPVQVLTNGNGISRIRSGAAFAAGAVLGIDTSGRAITWTQGYVLGRALVACSAAETIVPVLTGV